MADRVQQVGLAEPALAVDEQRVVGLGRRLGDGDRRGVREPVGRADDEGLEGVLGVEPRRLDRAAGARASALRADPAVGPVPGPQSVRSSAAVRAPAGQAPAARAPDVRAGRRRPSAATVRRDVGVRGTAPASGAHVVGPDRHGDLDVAAVRRRQRLRDRPGAAGCRARPWRTRWARRAARCPRTSPSGRVSRTQARCCGRERAVGRSPATARAHTSSRDTGSPPAEPTSASVTRSPRSRRSARPAVPRTLVRSDGRAGIARPCLRRRRLSTPVSTGCGDRDATLTAVARTGGRHVTLLGSSTRTAPRPEHVDAPGPGFRRRGR